MKDLTEDLVQTLERLIDSVDKLTDQGAHRIPNLTATVDPEREADLLRRLEAAESKIDEANSRIAEANSKIAEADNKIAELTASAHTPGRKTSMQTKHTDALNPAALDTALASLSIEQRIAVKAELLRNGAIV